MNNNNLIIDNWISLVLSIIAVLISLYSVYLTYRKNINNVITKNRMVWIAEIRELVNKFLTEYEGDASKQKMTNLRNHIYLYMNMKNNNKNYNELASCLNECINSDYSVKNRENLILACQAVLSDVWVRLKREGGMSEKSDKYYASFSR